MGGLTATFSEGAAAAFEDLALEGVFESVDAAASAFAQEQAAELVTNIEESTRASLRALVDRAFEEGLSPSQLAAAIEEAYSFSDERAELIARTELAIAQCGGALATWKDSGVVTGKRWLLGSEHGIEDECNDNEADGVIALDDQFSSGDETAPAHPRCLPGDAVVAAAGVTQYFKRWFAGELVCIRTEAGNEVAVTPNHPVLTGRGWVAAGQVVEGDYVAYCGAPSVVAFIDPDDHHMEARVEDLFDAAVMALKVAPCAVPVTAEAFHGDGIANTEVKIVAAAGLLKGERQTVLSKKLSHLALRLRHRWRIRLATERAHDLLGDRNRTALGYGMRLLDNLGALLRRVAGPGKFLGLSNGPNRQAKPLEPLAERRAITAQLASQLDGGFASFVTAVKVTDVSRREYFGHVYNLSTKSQVYLANRLIVHNCVCDVAAEVTSVLEDTD